MGYITEKEKRIPIIGEYELCVLGGGCTGVFAAVRAARLGMKVVIIEKTNCFGGACTLSNINAWHSIYDFDFQQKIIGGLTVEILESLNKRNDLNIYEKNLNMFRFNSEELKIELDRIVYENDIKYYFHTLYTAPVISEKKSLEGIYVENKDGRGAIISAFFIDATGDGDLCRDLKIERNIDFNCLMPPSPCFRLYKKNDYPVYITQLIKEYGKEFGLNNDWGWNADIPGIDSERTLVETHIFNSPCISADNISVNEVAGRVQIRAVVDLLRKYMPDNDEVKIASIASMLGIRESYKYKTLYYMKNEDVLGVGEDFYDAILNSSYPMDIHYPDSKGVTMRYLNGHEKTYNRANCNRTIWKDYSELKYPQYWQAPYRTMLLEEYDNVLVAGRMIHSEHGAFSAMRVRINLNQLGEAAGVAAFVAYKTNQELKNININELQNKLRQGGSIIMRATKKID